MNKVAVINTVGRFRRFEIPVKKTVLRILEILNKKDVSAEIYLIDSSKIKILNRELRGKDKPTNILSFKEPKNFIYPDKNEQKLGEIYLNLEMTADYRLQTTGERKKTADSSLLSVDELLIHGILHLIGYDHEKESDRIKMEKREKEVIRKLH